MAPCKAALDHLLMQMIISQLRVSHTVVHTTTHPLVVTPRAVIKHRVISASKMSYHLTRLCLLVHNLKLTPQLQSQVGTGIGLITGISAVLSGSVLVTSISGRDKLVLNGINGSLVFSSQI
jgi:hypothetical protein